MVVIETVARLVPGVLGNRSSSIEESFDDDLLEYPQWTRPSEFRGSKVPEILVSGDHARVEKWRLAMAIVRTSELRPDLLELRGVSKEEIAVLEEFDISIDERFVSAEMPERPHHITGCKSKNTPQRAPLTAILCNLRKADSLNPVGKSETTST